MISPVRKGHKWTAIFPWSTPDEEWTVLFLIPPLPRNRDSRARWWTLTASSSRRPSPMAVCRYPRAYPHLRGAQCAVRDQPKQRQSACALLYYQRGVQAHSLEVYYREHWIGRGRSIYGKPKEDHRSRCQTPELRSLRPAVGAFDFRPESKPELSEAARFSFFAPAQDEDPEVPQRWPIMAERWENQWHLFTLTFNPQNWSELQRVVYIYLYIYKYEYVYAYWYIYIICNILITSIYIHIAIEICIIIYIISGTPICICIYIIGYTTIYIYIIYILYIYLYAVQVNDW